MSFRKKLYTVTNLRKDASFFVLVSTNKNDMSDVLFVTNRVERIKSSSTTSWEYPSNKSHNPGKSDDKD